MNILVVSKLGDTLSLAERIKREGHTVNFYINDKPARVVGNSIIPKPRFSQPLVGGESGKVLKSNVHSLLRETQPDLVVFDMVGMGEAADYIKSLQIPVFGASKWADFAELDREYGTKLMKSAGIKTPPTKAFKAGQHDTAIKYVASLDNRCVYKPSGNISTSHTYVSKGSADMCTMLDLWKDDKEDFEIQTFIDGVEVSCELWWDGLSSSFHNWTMEEKKFMNEGIGPATGCAGNVVSPISPKSKLVSEGVGRMERLLKKSNYRGPIDLNSIVNETGLYGLEFTVRFGYDALQALLELYRGSITELLYSIATNSSTHPSLLPEFAIAVRITVPPYPSSEAKSLPGIPILGISKENLKHLWFSDISLDLDYYATAGYDGNVGCVTARGEDVRECKRRAYRTISNLTIPQLQYRTDIGDRVTSDLAKLKRWGYL